MDISNGRNVDNGEVNVNPQIGMEFDSEVAAYNFYNEYGRRVGFSIRRGQVGRNKQSKEFTSRIFKCCKEGVRDTRRREQLPKNPRAETRCGCNACMGIKLYRDKGKFEIYLLTVEHNHELVPSRCSYMMGSQRRISKLHATQIDLAEISGIPLRSAYELLGREAGGRESLGFIKLDQKNYLRSRRQKKLAFGEAGSIYEYFKKKSMENDAFYSNFQFDEEELITNIFWADARMIMDYGIFGDVVSFDTTYKINKEHQPFAVFVGFNHHRETVVFGVALMYDETVEPYKWLFRTFLEAMSHKAPKTILTDQDAAMAIAIKEVFLSSFHRLCKWHIMQNALKHTNNIGTANHGIGTIKSKIAHLMDNIDTEQEFLDVWDTMLEAHNVRGNRWLKGLFDARQKWAHCFVSYEWSAGMKSTQLSESFNACLKGYLKSDHDIVQFFMHFERVLCDNREAELSSDYNLIHRLPKINIKVLMVEQAALHYARRPFEDFQEEYIRSLELTTQSYDRNDAGNMVYHICAFNVQQKYYVTRNMVDDGLICTCRRFETIGIICRHALKVLREHINPIELPHRYILKRWTRAARSTLVEDRQGQTIVEDPKLKETGRYKNICALYRKLAVRAAQSHDTYIHVMEEGRKIQDKVEDIFLKGMDQLLESSITGTRNSVGITETRNSVGESSTLNLVNFNRLASGLKPRTDPFRRKKRQKSAMERSMEKAKKVSKKKNKQAATQNPISCEVYTPQIASHSQAYVCSQDITWARDGSLMPSGQWFYHSNEAEKKGGGGWQSSSFASPNDHADQKIDKFNQQANVTDHMLARIGEEAGANH